MKPLFRAVALFCFAACLCRADPIIREPGAIYLSDFGQKPLRLKLLQPAPCYFDSALTRYGGTLRFPQVIDVEAVLGGTFRIHGYAQQGGVAAWMSPKYLEPLPDGFLANLRKAEERRQTVVALIAKNQVAIGMTSDEVLQSVGKPQKKTSMADQSGTQQIWEYIKYALMPQTTWVQGGPQSIVTPAGLVVAGGSGLYPQTIYVKVPVGKLAITFKDDVVQSMNQTEGTTETAGETTVVAPPVLVY